jgi:hypothetical protein
MSARRIDLEAAQRLLDAGCSVPAAAQAMGFSRVAVWEAIKRGALKFGHVAVTIGAERKTAQVYRGFKKTPERIEPPKPELPPRTASLIATGGHYTELAQWAEKWGRTQRQAQQDWHGLRLPISRRPE